jgi:hypothetical protein
VRLYVGPAYGEDLDRTQRDARLAALRDDEPLARFPRYPREGEYLRTEGGQLVWLGDEPPVLPLAWLTDERVADVARVLRQAFRRQAELSARERLGEEALSILLTTIEGDEFLALAEAHDEEFAPVSQVRLVVGDGSSLDVGGVVPRSAGLDDDDVEAIAASVLPKGLTVVTSEVGSVSSRMDSVRIRARLSQRSRLTLGEALRAGEGLAALLELGALDMVGAWALLASGRAQMLVGQRESDWLEVKSHAYLLNAPAQVIEAGQDAARMANGEGGIVACGFRTKRGPGGERIAALAPVRCDRRDAVRLRAALDRVVYPPIPGLRVAAYPVEGEAGQILAVYVPHQQPSLRPFLVHGAVAAGKVEGAFISIVARRGEGSVVTTAAQIHALLAGRLVQDPEPSTEHVALSSLGLDDMRAATSSTMTAMTSVPPPRHRIDSFAVPANMDTTRDWLAAQADTPVVVLRVASVHPPTLPQPVIEPRHRRRLLAALVDGKGEWQQPSQEHQSTASAILVRTVDEPDAHCRARLECLTVTMGSVDPRLIVIADVVLAVEGPISLTHLVDEWAILLQRGVAGIRDALRAISRQAALPSAVELHVQASAGDYGQPRPLETVVSLGELGDGPGRPPITGGTVVLGSAVVAGAERSVVLDALRKISLDWGYLDPDSTLRGLGWQP